MRHEPPRTPDTGRLRTGRRLSFSGVITFAVVLVALYFVFRSLLSGLGEAEDPASLLSFDPVLLALSFLVLAVHFVVAALTWKLVLGLSGAEVGFRQAWVIHYTSQLGKYIPGKVWAVVGKVGLSTRRGVQTSAASHGIILETLLILTSVLILSLPLVPPMGSALGLGSGVSTVVVALAIVLLLAMGHPALLGRVLELVSRLMKQSIAWDHPDIAAILRLLPVYVFMFLLMGFAFLLLCWSFGVELALWPGICAFPAAVAIGYVFLPAPGGLGVREISLVWLVGLVLGLQGPPASMVPEGQVELISIAARLWITIGELLGFGVALLLGRGRAGRRRRPVGAGSVEGVDPGS